MPNTINSKFSSSFDAGFIKSFAGELRFMFHLEADGNSYVSIDGHDPSDLRKAGVGLLLHPSDYRKLKGIISTLDSTMLELEKEGHLKPGYWTESDFK